MLLPVPYLPLAQLQRSDGESKTQTNAKHTTQSITPSAMANSRKDYVKYVDQTNSFTGITTTIPSPSMFAGFAPRIILYNMRDVLVSAPECSMCGGLGHCTIHGAEPDSPQEHIPCPVCSGFPIIDHTSDSLGQAVDQVIFNFDRMMMATKWDAHTRVAASDNLFEAIKKLKTIREF